MKTCRRCLIEKSKEFFFARKCNSDGLYSYCKECVKKESQARYKRNIELNPNKLREDYQKNREKRLAKSNLYYKNNREIVLKKSEIYRKNNKYKISFKEALRRINDLDRFEKNRSRHYQWVSKNRDRINTYQRNWYQKNKEKRRAHVLVKRAIEKGSLIRSPFCEECKSITKTDGHHEDYSKPLEVKWICRRCHSRKSPKTVIKIFN